MEKRDLMNNNLSKEMKLEINFTGEEYKKFVEITTLNKKLVAIDKIIKNTIDSLKKTRKIPNQNEIIDSIQVDLKRNSIDNTILVYFISPIVATVIGNLLADYIVYLAKEYKKDLPKEFEFLNKNMNNLSQINNLILNKDINSKIEIKFENNNYVIDNERNIEIKRTIDEIKDSFEIKEIEDTVIGKIEKLDRGKDNYYLTMENYNKPVPVTFQNYLNDDELREILFHRLLIDLIKRQKNEEIISVHILDYKIITPRTINDYDN